jgi:hypothetical protein
MKTFLIIVAVLIVAFVLYRIVYWVYNYWTSVKEWKEFEVENAKADAQRMRNCESFPKQLAAFDNLSDKEQEQLIEMVEDVVYRLYLDYDRCNKSIMGWISDLSLNSNKLKLCDAYYEAAGYVELSWVQKNMTTLFNEAVANIPKRNKNISEVNIASLEVLYERSWLSIESLLILSKIEYDYLKSAGLSTITAKDMVINRPCFLKAQGHTVDLRQKDGERFYDMENLLQSTIYLFEDTLELLGDGHRSINLADVLDISLDKEMEPEEGQVMLILTIRNKSALYFRCNMRVAAQLMAIAPLLKQGEVPLKSQSIIEERQIQERVKTNKKPTIISKKTKKMENIYLKPWVGKNYEKGFNGKKLMVVGVSHYATPEEWNPDFTTYIVKDCYLNPECERENWMKTYTVFERALAGREISGKEKNEVWDSLAFWNFIQEPMSDWKGKATDPQIEVGQNFFFGNT